LMRLQRVWRGSRRQVHPPVCDSGAILPPRLRPTGATEAPLQFCAGLSRLAREMAEETPLVQQASIVHSYVVAALLNHGIVKPVGKGETVWAGVDFTRN